MCLVCVCLIFRKTNNWYKIIFIIWGERRKSFYRCPSSPTIPSFSVFFPDASHSLSSSKTKPMPSQSSSPSMKTKIHGWASLSFGSHLHCQYSKTQQWIKIFSPPKPTEDCATSTPKTCGPTTNLGSKNTLTLVVNGFLSRDCCVPSSYT